MPDTYTLSFQNFRSIEDATIEVAPLTVSLWAKRFRQVFPDLRTADAEELPHQPEPEHA